MSLTKEQIERAKVLLELNSIPFEEWLTIDNPPVPKEFLEEASK